MANFHPMRQTAVWLKNHIGKKRAKPKGQPSRLEALPREVKDEIVSYLCPTELNTFRLVSHNLQVSALNTWRLEIPLAKRRALTETDSRPSAGAWRQAWLSQCAHLETLGPWGTQASLACKFLPDELNPYDVEFQCREWLNSETASGNTQANEVLKDLFNAVHQNKSVLDWHGKNLHSLPPFMNKIKALQRLNLENNQLAAIDLKDLPALHLLFLHNNQLAAVDLKDLPALQRLDLHNNQLAAVDLKDLPALQRLDLHNNQHHLVSSEYRYAIA
jgi:Leucine-rich repeat (LRR) protein